MIVAAERGSQVVDVRCARWCGAGCDAAFPANAAIGLGLKAVSDTFVDLPGDLKTPRAARGHHRGGAHDGGGAEW
ncbi:hypothetical protein [Micromonospora sp. CPCC 206061]|uniref:hypothetical protein n=1 Tax=Micromonospora sp. CPCC 206061 TaxID=3122410 RepID=UPI002FF2723A